MKFLALDLGANFAGADNLGREDSVWHMELTGTRPERFQQMRHALDLLLADVFMELDAVVYERPFVRGRDATRCMWGYAAQIEAACAFWQVAVLDQEPQQIKKFATGKGGADKQAMIAAAQRFGYYGENEHEADAFCLLKYAEAVVVNDGVRGSDAIPEPRGRTRT